MKQDMRRLQDFNTAAKGDLERYERQLQMLSDEISAANDRNRKSVEELATKVCS